MKTIKEHGVNLIVCLIADIEIRSLGVNLKDYQLYCNKLGIELFKYPIVECAPPQNLEEWNQTVVNKIVKHIIDNKGNVLIHCRGGIGRAGTLACNVLSALFKF